MADAADSKSADLYGSCRFKSGLRHTIKNPHICGGFVLCVEVDLNEAVRLLFRPSYLIVRQRRTYHAEVLGARERGKGRSASGTK